MPNVVSSILRYKNFNMYLHSGLCIYTCGAKLSDHYILYFFDSQEVQLQALKILIVVRLEREEDGGKVEAGE